MKKRSFKITDVFIIIVLLACIAGIAARAVKISGVKAEKYDQYRVRFEARLDAARLDGLRSGVKLTDKNGTGYVLLEGYWITQEGDTASVSGEFLVSGRMTEKGFECGGGYYFKNDVVSLKGNNLEFEASITDFIRQ